MHNVLENTDLMGQGRGRVNKQAEVVIQIIRGTKGEGSRVVGKDMEIGSKPEL